MTKKILEIIAQNKFRSQKKDGISVIQVNNENQGLTLAKNTLYELVDNNTLLFLSGGSTPKPLYRNLAKEKKLNLGAVAMVDERYDKPNHKNSNEWMIGNTGLLSYLKKKNILFYPILRVTPSVGTRLFHPKGGHRETASCYEKVVDDLLEKLKTRIAIMGVGEDGHTAGIAPNRKDFKNPLFDKNRKDLLVDSFKDRKRVEEGGFGERITLTLKALAKMDLLLVLVFGSVKHKALGLMFEAGLIEQIPARFYTKSEIAEKTLLITDQKL